MKIAIVTDYHNKTGIGKQNYQLYRALLDLGHEAEIINLVSSQGFKETPTYGVNLEASSFLKGSFFTFRKLLAERLARNRYDVVLLGHQGLAHLRKTTESSGIPTVLTVFDLFALYDQYSPWWDARFLVFNHCFLGQAKNFANVAFSSAFTLRDYQRFFHKDPERSAVIPIGIPAENRTWLDNQANRWAEAFAGKKVVLQVGSSDKRKNSGAYFNIARAALEDISFADTVFVRVGKTPDEDKAAAPKNMVFLQNLSEADLFALYEYASIFVFTSWHEGYGMPVAEARAVGLPVVSSKVSDMAELFSGDPGALFVNDANDTDEYLGKIKEILSLETSKIPSPVVPTLGTRDEAEKYVSFFRQIPGVS